MDCIALAQDKARWGGNCECGSERGEYLDQLGAMLASQEGLTPRA